jgi:hypothetical protein
LPWAFGPVANKLSSLLFVVTAQFVQVAMHLHEADGGETVEPGVARGLHDLREALLLDLCGELFALGSDGLWVGLSFDDDELALLAHGRGAPRGEAELRGAARRMTAAMKSCRALGAYCFNRLVSMVLLFLTEHFFSFFSQTVFLRWAAW